MRHNLILSAAVLVVLIFVIEQTESAAAREKVVVKIKSKKKSSGGKAKGAKKLRTIIDSFEDDYMSGFTTESQAQFTTENETTAYTTTEAPPPSPELPPDDQTMAPLLDSPGRNAEVAPAEETQASETTTDSEIKSSEVKAETTPPTPNADLASSGTVTEDADFRIQRDEFIEMFAEEERERVREENLRQSPTIPNEFGGLDIGPLVGMFSGGYEIARPNQPDVSPEEQANQ